MARSMVGLVGMFKINLHLFTAEGPDAVRKIGALGPGIFLDLKYHDIPNTVAGAISAAAELPKVRLLDLHTTGSEAMMRAGADVLAKLGADRPKLLGITILTSLKQSDLRRVGIGARGEKMRIGWGGSFAARGTPDSSRLRPRFPDCRTGDSADFRRTEAS